MKSFQLTFLSSKLNSKLKNRQQIDNKSIHIGIGLYRGRLYRGHYSGMELFLVYPKLTSPPMRKWLPSRSTVAIFFLARTISPRISDLKSKDGSINFRNFFSNPKILRFYHQTKCQKTSDMKSEMITFKSWTQI